MTPGDFREIWCADFEFTQPPGERPQPICAVFHELRSDRWVESFDPISPLPIDDDSLFVSYAASAEMSCFLALGWQLPKHVIDLFAEYRLLTNSIERDNRHASSLLAASAHFQIPHIESELKDKMRALAIRGGPWTDGEKRSLLGYCKSDVKPLPALFDKLVGGYKPEMFDQALLRGGYAKAVAAMEHAGIPIDTDTLGELRDRWDDIRLALIREVDQDFHVYDGTHFKFDRFSGWLKRRGIAWPTTPSGRLCSDDDTFRAMAAAHPELQSLQELRATLSSMKLESLSVGADGRNRTQLKPFTTVTGRNAPSNSQFVFGPATWIRCLIKPEPGTTLAYVDFEQQEFGVAASLSGDENMQAAYASGDPYLEFAKQAGAVPPDATKKSHGAIRDLYKTCSLAVQYGMTDKSLAVRISRTETQAARLIEKHRRAYPQFWSWKDHILTHLQLLHSYATSSGWRVTQGGKLTEHYRRSLTNFPVQATAADMFRLACVLGTEAGVQICAPVHDAVLIQAPSARLDRQISLMRSLMAKASRQSLGGFEIRTEVKIITDRFSDPRGRSTWELVRGLLTRCPTPPKQFGLFEMENSGVPSPTSPH
jgi:DNA polymerase family A